MLNVPSFYALDKIAQRLTVYVAATDTGWVPYSLKPLNGPVIPIYTRSMNFYDQTLKFVKEHGLLLLYGR
jgi:hypothetical protein